MPRSSLKEIHQTIKTMFSYALSLSESQIPTVYELAHYLADNILAKICLAVAIDKGEEQQTFTSTKYSTKTKGLFDLYNDHLKPHYSQVPNYDPDIKQFHEERNVYQHDVESFDMTMRQPRAISYIKIVEQIMRIVGIIAIGETIQPRSLTGSIKANNQSVRQIQLKETKYQQLHDLFKKKNDPDIIIKIKNQLDWMTIYDLKKILSMQSSPPYQSPIFIWNSRFQILYAGTMSGPRLTITRKGVNEASYNPMVPDMNRDVLDDFLEYYRNCFKDIGINLINS